MIEIKKLFEDKHGRLDSSKIILHGYRAVIITSIIVLYIMHAKVCA
jgi:hypothetical protein|tara:strand:- start:439 stop:576 length:138 start_codon:yes stop_codon:yes gene_type:complete